MFYQQIAGGMLATVLALGTAALDLGVDTSLVVTASIVLLLSGIGFMGAIQDALSGFYITAGARIIEAMLATAGLIAGVSAGLALAPVLGVSLVDVRPGDIGLADQVAARARRGDRRGELPSRSPATRRCASLPAVAMSTLLGHLAYLAVQRPASSRCRGPRRARRWRSGWSATRSPAGSAYPRWWWWSPPWCRCCPGC